VGFTDVAYHIGSLAEGGEGGPKDITSGLCGAAVSRGAIDQVAGGGENNAGNVPV
jgi:hypothetical protein